MQGIGSPENLILTHVNEFVLHNDTNLLHLIYLYFLRELPAMKKCKIHP
jgi:hypothetical protein